MSSSLENKEKNIIVLTCEISAENFKKAMETAYKKDAKRYTVPGFRKGKAPFSYVVRYYGEGNFYESAIDLLANEAYQSALAEHDIKPEARPEMNVIDIGLKQGLKLSFTVATKPEVAVGKYKGMKVEKEELVLSEEELKAELQKIQQKNSRILNVEDRAAQLGDIATIDFEGFVDGEAFNGGKGESYDLELGSNTFIPGFEDQIVGHTINEKFDVNVIFPEEYAAEELKGKKALFKCELKQLKTKELPELDDEFVKDISEFDTLAEFENDLREKLSKAKEKRINEQFEDNVIKSLVDITKVDVPKLIVDDEIDRIVERQAQMMRYQGIELSQYLTYIGKTLEEFKQTYSEQALNNIKARYALETVQNLENITVDNEDLELEYAQMAEQYKKSVEEVKKIFSHDASSIEHTIKVRKTIDLLVKNAKAVIPKVDK